MKRTFIKCMLLIVALLAMFIIPNVFAEEEVYVEEIILVDHSSTASEKSAPTKDGLNIAFDLSFSDVDDYAKYKIVVNNPTDTSYELNKNIDFKSSDYLEYKAEFEEDNNIIGGHQKLNLFITITYKTAVPTEMLTDGKLIENNSLSLNLSNETGDTIMNPSTIDRLLLYVFTLIFTSGFSIAFYVITKKRKYLSIFVLGLLLIPFEAYAIEKLEFKIDTKVVIEKKYSVYYMYSDYIKTSEKDNYNLVSPDSCQPIENSEYEDCLVYYQDPVFYAKGEKVPFIENINITEMDNLGNVEEVTIVLGKEAQDSDFVLLYNVSDPETQNDEPYQSNFGEENILQTVIYKADTCILINAPGNFTMQGHDMYYEITSFNWWQK